MKPAIPLVMSAEDAVTQVLTAEGFRLKRGFNLQEAISAHPDSVCPCHGTRDCECQYLLLLVYSEGDGEPLAVSIGDLRQCDRCLKSTSRWRA